MCKGDFVRKFALLFLEAVSYIHILTLKHFLPLVFDYTEFFFKEWQK